MDLHAPGAPIHTLKDFFVHLGIVTLGILIALGLEQLVEMHHRSVIAREAVAAFRREIADNEQNVKDEIAAMPELRAKIAAAVQKLMSPVAPGATEEPIAYPGINLDFTSSASWDTAIATQALNDIPYDAVRLYAEAFVTLRLFLDEERAGVVIWRDLRRFGTSPAALTKEQRVALIEDLRRYDSFTYAIDSIGKGTLHSCDLALGIAAH